MPRGLQPNGAHWPRATTSDNTTTSLVLLCQKQFQVLHVECFTLRLASPKAGSIIIPLLQEAVTEAEVLRKFSGNAMLADPGLGPGEGCRHSPGECPLCSGCGSSQRPKPEAQDECDAQTASRRRRRSQSHTCTHQRTHPLPCSACQPTPSLCSTLAKAPTRAVETSSAVCAFLLGHTLCFKDLLNFVLA